MVFFRTGWLVACVFLCLCYSISLIQLLIGTAANMKISLLMRSFVLIISYCKLIAKNCCAGPGQSLPTMTLYCLPAAISILNCYFRKKKQQQKTHNQNTWHSSRWVNNEWKKMYLLSSKNRFAEHLNGEERNFIHFIPDLCQ